jgi:hypothetical protein
MSERQDEVAAYLEPSRWRVVDAGQKWEAVQDGLRKVILDAGK